SRLPVAQSDPPELYCRHGPPGHQSPRRAHPWPVQRIAIVFALDLLCKLRHWGIVRANGRYEPPLDQIDPGDQRLARRSRPSNIAFHTSSWHGTRSRRNPHARELTSMCLPRAAITGSTIRLPLTLPDTVLSTFPHQE